LTKGEPKLSGQNDVDAPPQGDQLGLDAEGELDLTVLVLWELWQTLRAQLPIRYRINE